MNITNAIDNKLSKSLYSGRVLAASAILVVIMLTAASLITCTGYENPPKIVIHKPKAGMVTGVIYNPPNSCAVVGDTIVREGDSIGDIAVVAILSDAVKFSKFGRTWQQEILERPHRVWKR